MEEKEKEDLNKMVDALIKNNSEEAQVDFHKYLGDKMKVYYNPDENTDGQPDDND